MRKILPEYERKEGDMTGWYIVYVLMLLAASLITQAWGWGWWGLLRWLR